MSKYRMSVSIYGESFFWIVVNNGKLIKNPTKDDLRGTKLKMYNKTNICPKCREDNNITDKSILYPGNALRGIDRDGKRIDEWVCHRHGDNYYQKYDHNSQCNIIKSMRDRRTGNLHNPDLIFSDNCEELTCIWRCVDNLNIENDNYKSPIDHSRDPELGIIQTKGSRLTTFRSGLLEYENWSRAFINEHMKEFDYLIFYCASKDGKIIERVYIIPQKEIIIRTGIAVVMNPSRGIQWYEQYRVKDESVLRKINEIWKEIIKGK